MTGYPGPFPCLVCPAFPDSTAAPFWCRDHLVPGDCPTFTAFEDRVAAYLYLLAAFPAEAVTVACVVARPAHGSAWTRGLVARRCLREDLEAAVADLRAECERSAAADGLALLAGPAAMAAVPPEIEAGLRGRAAHGNNGGFFEFTMPDPEVDAFVARHLAAEGAA
jgi:hypothetical protein